MKVFQMKQEKIGTTASSGWFEDASKSLIIILIGLQFLITLSLSLSLSLSGGGGDYFPYIATWNASQPSTWIVTISHSDACPIKALLEVVECVVSCEGTVQGSFCH